MTMAWVLAHKVVLESSCCLRDRLVLVERLFLLQGSASALWRTAFFVENGLFVLQGAAFPGMQDDFVLGELWQTFENFGYI